MTFGTLSIQSDSGGQAIRIPESHKIHDDKVYVKRVGDALYLIPFHNPWQNLFDSLGAFTPDYMEDRSQLWIFTFPALNKTPAAFLNEAGVFVSKKMLVVRV